MYNNELHPTKSFLINLKYNIQLKLYRLFYKFQSNSIVSTPIYMVK